MLRSNVSSSYTLHRSSRRQRSVALDVKADGSLHVSAPMRTSVKWIEAFILEKEPWIAHRRQEVRLIQNRKKTALKEGDIVDFMGEKKKITLTPRKDDNTILLTVHTPSSDEIALALTLWYKKQARYILPKRCASWAKRMALMPQSVKVTSPKRQWGSCSADNVIRLNWRLIIMPEAIIDYVIVHELAHIKHKNHGSRFWNLVEAHIPNHKEKRATLRTWEKQYPADEN